MDPSPAHAGPTVHSPVRHLMGAVAVVAALAFPTGVSAQAPAPQASLPDIEDEVMCPVCGTTLDLATEAPQANREREFIRGLIAEGQTKDEIKDALVAEFGPEVLALPEGEGFDLAAWLVPGAAIVGGGIAILVGLRRWRRAGLPDPAGGSADASAPEGEEAKRLEEDLERYDL